MTEEMGQPEISEEESHHLLPVPVLMPAVEELEVEVAPDLPQDPEAGPGLGPGPSPGPGLDLDLDQAQGPNLDHGLDPDHLHRKEVDPDQVHLRPKAVVHLVRVHQAQLGHQAGIHVAVVDQARVHHGQEHLQDQSLGVVRALHHQQDQIKYQITKRLSWNKNYLLCILYWHCSKLSSLHSTHMCRKTLWDRT